MQAQLKHIADAICNNATIMGEIPEANVYPVVAEATVPPGPFLVYNVRRDRRETKNLFDSYTAEILVFGPTALEACRLSDIVEAELYQDENLKMGPATLEYSQDLSRAFVRVILTFKL